MNSSSRLLPLLVFGFTLPLSAADGPAPVSAPAAVRTPKPMLGSTIFKWEDLAVRISPVGERRDVSDNPTPTLAVFECHITTLNPGKASHPPHRHNQEELIFMKEGTAEIHINGETQRAGPGSVFFYASNDLHNVTNVGDSRATYWVVNLATAVTHDLEKHHKASTLHSGVFDWAKMTPTPTGSGERRAVCQGSTVTLENLSVHISTVNPGEATHTPHRHPDEEIVIVKEGALDVTINGKTERANAGSIILFASNDLHGMRNAAASRTTYYVIRAVTTATPKAITEAK
jgi:quercetin dioxygenase-like cupin family protein